MDAIDRRIKRKNQLIDNKIKGSIAETDVISDLKGTGDVRRTGRGSDCAYRERGKTSWENV
ncbi:MAG: hypothetical protein V1835_01315 [Candidatus Micrarchaeota archaeon]